MYLRLSQCDITSLHGLAWANASQLERLDICLALTSLQPLHACGLSRLTRFFLGYCHVLPSLDGLGTLCLHHFPQLTSLQPVLDAGAISLREVDVTGCTHAGAAFAGVGV